MNFFQYRPIFLYFSDSSHHDEGLIPRIQRKTQQKVREKIRKYQGKKLDKIYNDGTAIP